LIFAAFILIGFQVGRAPGPGQDAMRAGDDISAAAGRVATGPARASENLFDRIAGMWNATGRVEELETEVRELHAWRDLAERLSERNARYEALLRMPPDAFGDGVSPDSSIAAQLVLDSGGPFTRTLVANAGADHGVRVGYIVLNEQGLVGRVVSVGRRSARVLMLDDYTSRIPVMGEASRVRAVLAGQATAPPELLMRPFELEAPRLDFVVGSHSLREGERLMTSGDGGLFPRGVTIGVARRDASGDWRVALSAGRQPIDFVRIVPYVGIERPEDAPVADAGPPPNVRGADASVTRNPVMAPPPTAAPTAPAAATRPHPPRTTAPAVAAAPAPTPAAATTLAPQPEPQPASPQ
jgi:rod shape-determining protein MreC